ncbi:trans-1,2-dihydrobenzene-1,2-diol dehydrogenase-like [Oppia nitens]|uniref:trans-1,2-dihydrobenzene-1,2-diol dehydrogenase-like n=1 Tax=Oppia nitens TaxID=1686743 RepID=UPI0023DC1183|nr:trans-1,2-dihydrobenzene-1,2-diol dehydrogenase-like [Oppia nitens]
MATRWGILSAGKISHDFVSALRTLPTDEHQLVAVAARDLQSAQQFAQLHGIPKAYGTYNELANDPDVQVVYIGTIHPHHLSTAKRVLARGKHVLVEKPMTLNSKGTDELIASARRSGLFLMEALWSRFLPSYEFVMKTISDGVIGDVQYVNVTFGMPIAEVDRVAKRVLGGGTILDIGIYAINIIEMVYNGEAPEEIRAVGHLNADGVDESVVAALKYSGGRTASISTSSRVKLPCEAVIVGTKGVLRLPMPFWCADRVYLNNVAYEFPLPEPAEPCNFFNSAGLRYEAIEVRKCLTTSSLESRVMSHKDSQLLAKIMDELRRQVGVKYDVDD